MCHEKKCGFVFWITGLSGTGKSENGARLVEFLRANGRPCILLDGDDIRAIVDNEDADSLSREGRLKLSMRYVRLCRLLASQGVDVVIATISLYSELHAQKSREIPSCCTIYLDVPIEELKRRDPKKIYARYFANEISNVAGLDLEVEPPPDPQIHIKWEAGMDRERVWEVLRQGVVKHIGDLGGHQHEL